MVCVVFIFPFSGININKVECRCVGNTVRDAFAAGININKVECRLDARCDRGPI